MSIHISPQFEQACSLMEHTSSHLFITGKAGTGKSTLLRYFCQHTKKQPIILAPTGVAAVNISGQTIHSFFGFKPDTTVNNVLRIKPLQRDLYKQIQTIVIDEISMVRADIIDCIDIFLRRYGPKKQAPFGGVQMIFIGDLYQLPPVVLSKERDIFYGGYYMSPYFFSAHCISPPQGLFVQEPFPLQHIILDTVYRQQDTEFISFLNAVRENSVTHDHMSYINTACTRRVSPDETVVSIVSTNAIADAINAKKLDELPTQVNVFQAKLSGEVDPRMFPTDERLSLKIGAHVMLQHNDPEGRWINGTMGVVKGFTQVEPVASVDGFDIDPTYATTEERVLVTLANGKTVAVAPYTWHVYVSSLDGGNDTIQTTPIGSFTQYPLRLAWAITIHKSQGKTFDRLHLDVGSGTFAPGQLYVALSRCTNLEGISLARPLQKKHVWVDDAVVAFMNAHRV